MTMRASRALAAAVASNASLAAPHAAAAPVEPLSPRRDAHVHLVIDAMAAATALRGASGATVNDWGTPEAAMGEDFPPTMLEPLDADTLSFTEVGGGLGGLPYRPPSTEACGARPIHYRALQEGGDERLSANGDCADFAGFR